PKSLSKSKRARTDPPGRGPSKSGFADLQRGRMDPMKELQQIIAVAGADPVMAGPRNVLPQMLQSQQMRGMAAQNGLPGAGGAPAIDPTTAAILQKILGAGAGMPPGISDGQDQEPDNDPDDGE
ncbi:MAG TPA: hypothetical protein VN039_12365, partial [Nitrospira sp.]|nr:hypothetical protein [Nitrospira sp.]